MWNDNDGRLWEKNIYCQHDPEHSFLQQAHSQVRHEKQVNSEKWAQKYKNEGL